MAADEPTPAQQALRSTLVELLLAKPLARIGVKELCAAARVSRSTFYAYYSNTDELLLELERTHVEQIAQMNVAVCNPEVSTSADMVFFDATLDYVQEHQRDFCALLVANPDPRFASMWKLEIIKHLRQRRRMSAAAPLSKLTEEVAASAVVSAIVCLLQEPDVVKPADVHIILSKAFVILDLQ